MLIRVGFEGPKDNSMMTSAANAQLSITLQGEILNQISAVCRSSLVSGSTVKLMRAQHIESMTNHD
jgi:hypothetical protein